MSETQDLSNRWLIGKAGDGFIILHPPKSLSTHEALVFAAYLVAMVGDEDHWLDIRAAVENL